MASRVFSLLCLLAISALDVQWASARTAGRNLGYYNSPTPSSGSSPDVSTPSYSPPPSSSGSSPSSGGSSSPYPDTPSGSSPSSDGGSPPYSTTPSGSSSSPVVDTTPVTSTSPPYSSGPSAGSISPSPDSVGSPLSSPIVGSPLTSPVVDSPLGSPLSTPSPDISTPSTPSGGYGGKGSCGFWSHHAVKFPSILSRLATLASIFGGKAPSIFGQKMTVMEALVNPNQDEFSALARHGTASLLNAYAFPNSFPFTPAQVRENFSLGLQSQLAARQQASLFEGANNLEH